MGIPTRTLVVFATVLVLVSGAVAVFDGYDGMPRPGGMDQAPTTTYGPKPAVKYAKKPADCVWYGWENGNYPLDGTKNCSRSLWASLSNADPASLAGFMYYAPLESIFFDPDYNEYLCAIGCFDLSGMHLSAPTPAPARDDASLSPASLPSMVATAPPSAPTRDDASFSPASLPSMVATAPPSAAPHPVVAATPPATLFRPPPLPAPVTSPSPSPGSIPIVMSPSESAPSPMMSTPGSSGPAAQITTPGLPGAQTGAGTVSTSASSVLIFAVSLILSISLLV